MTSGGFLRIRNWERYQHYKTGPNCEDERKASGKGPLPWLELHHLILDDYELMSLPLATQAIAFKMLCLARRTFNRIPAESDALAFSLRCQVSDINKSIPALLTVGWIEGEWPPSRQRLDIVSRQPSRQLSNVDCAPVLTQDPQDKTEQDPQDNHCPPVGGPRVPFEQFWTAYPRRTAKKRAKEAWSRLKVTFDLWQRMEAALEIQKRCQQWQDPRLIPHPATWLNGHRWEDEPIEAGGVVRYFEPVAMEGKADG